MMQTKPVKSTPLMKNFRNRTETCLNLVDVVDWFCSPVGMVEVLAATGHHQVEELGDGPNAKRRPRVEILDLCHEPCPTDVAG